MNPGDGGGGGHGKVTVTAPSTMQIEEARFRGGIANQAAGVD